MTPLHMLQVYSSAPRWGLAYHTNSRSPRAKRWYYIARFAFVDGSWFELYWHPDLTLRGENGPTLRKAANAQGLDVASGLFRHATFQLFNEMEHVA